MTTNEVAAQFGISRQRVQQLLAEGRLRSVLRGRDHDIDEQSFREEQERRARIVEVERP